MARRSTGRHRYAAYDGGPDPLAPPVDLAEALDAIGQDVMAGYSPERAMQEFLRRGGRDQTGLDDLALLVDAIDAGSMVTTGEQVSARDFLAGLPVLGESDLYDQVTDRLGATDDGERASAIELALEGLYLARKVGKESGGRETVYG